MNRYELRTNRGHRHSPGLTRQVVVFAAALALALVLVAPAVSAGEYSICDQVKKGVSGQHYAWKKDC